MYVSITSAILCSPQTAAPGRVRTPCAPAAASRRRISRLAALAVSRTAGHQFLRRHLALGRLGQLDDEVYDLFLENRRPEVVNRIGILAIIVDDLPLVTGK